MDGIWKALIAEFLGTFLLVLIGASAVALTLASGGSALMSALAFGLALVVMIYTFGAYSGGHFNPATSLGFAVAGRMNWLLMLGYWIAQLLGGIAAGALVAYFFGVRPNGTNLGGQSVGASVGSLTYTDAVKAIIVEAFLTFLLVIATLFVTANLRFGLLAGLIVGITLAVCIMAGYWLTGASMNPARTLGPALFSANMGSFWIYVLGPLIGAIVAALVWRALITVWGCDKEDTYVVSMDDCGKIKACKVNPGAQCVTPGPGCPGIVCDPVKPSCPPCEKKAEVVVKTCNEPKVKSACVTPSQKCKDGTTVYGNKVNNNGYSLNGNGNNNGYSLNGNGNGNGYTSTRRTVSFNDEGEGLKSISSRSTSSSLRSGTTSRVNSALRNVGTTSAF